MIEKLDYSRFWSIIHESDEQFAGMGDKAREEQIQMAKILLLESGLELIINEIIHCRFDTDFLRKKLTRENKIILLHELGIIEEDDKKDLMKIKEIRDLFGHNFVQTAEFIQEIENKATSLAFYNKLGSYSPSVLDSAKTTVGKFIISTSNFLNHMGKIYDEVYAEFQEKQTKID